MTDEGFIGRWSRRKRAAREPGGDETPGTELADGADPIAVKAKPQRPGVMNTEASEPTIGELAGPDEPAADDAVAADPTADLTPIDRLDESSDYTGFMRDGVPAELKKAALRRLWRSNPIIAHLDGLDDYDEDFTAITAVVAGLDKMRQAGRRLADGDRKGTPEEEVAAPPEADAPPPEPAESEPEAAADKPVAEADSGDENGAPADRSGDA